MKAKDLFGPSTLEQYALCSYRWFVERELEPQSIDPEGDALTAGDVAHKVLEKLYAARPADERRPTSATLPEWQRRAGELIAELGRERLPADQADTAATLRRVEGMVLAFLADEARSDTPFLPEPGLAEAGFGVDGAEKGPLMLGSGGVHGVVDRVDIGPGGLALVQDYKTAKKVDGGTGMLDRGKLQIQLYLLAVRELWGLDLAGGLYRPLGGTSDRQPKGLLRKDVAEDLAALDPRPGDRLADEDFDQALDSARGKAAEIIASIQEGEVTRNPLNHRCPDYCRFQPICRRERGLPEEEPGPEDEEES